jgi:hypothetical protein
MPAQSELTRFIRATFRSVWTLELLIHLKRSGRAMSRAELVAGLRASEAVVTNATASLFSAGLVMVEEEQQVRYAPATPDLDDLAERAVALYAQRPDAVRRMIVTAVGDPAAAFSDAFRFRRD